MVNLKNSKGRDQFTIDIIYYLELDQSDFKSNEFQQFRILNECSIRKYSKVQE